MKKTTLGYMLGLALLMGMPLAGAAIAQEYPNKPITLVVPFPPGGGADLAGRMLAQQMSKNLGAPVVVENMPGGSTIIGAGHVAKANPDGYTLLLGSTGLAINAAVRDDLPYDTLEDLAPISLVVGGPLFLVASLQSGITSLDDLVAKAKANPGVLTYASTGVLGTQHLRFEMLSDALGIDLVHVPYKGGAAAQLDLLGGHVDISMSTVPEVASLIESGSIRALGITTPDRLASLPDVPPIAERIEGYNETTWFALFAPAGTPDAILEKLNGSVASALLEPDLIETLARDGSIAIPSTRQELNDFLRVDISRWAEAVKLIE